MRTHASRELKPRIRIDRTKNTIAARENVRSILFLSGGVIPDRGYFNMRESDSNAKIGELDEEFVWERSLGRCIPLWQPDMADPACDPQRRVCQARVAQQLADPVLEG